VLVAIMVIAIAALAVGELLDNSADAPARGSS